MSRFGTSSTIKDHIRHGKRTVPVVLGADAARARLHELTASPLSGGTGV
ncbi:hypothetical protein ACWGKK_43195 [Streptomyces chartreusis]